MTQVSSVHWRTEWIWSDSIQPLQNSRFQDFLSGKFGLLRTVAQHSSSWMNARMMALNDQLCCSKQGLANARHCPNVVFEVNFVSTRYVWSINCKHINCKKLYNTLVIYSRGTSGPSVITVRNHSANLIFLKTGMLGRRVFTVFLCSSAAPRYFCYFLKAICIDLDMLKAFLWGLCENSFSRNIFRSSFDFSMRMKVQNEFARNSFVSLWSIFSICPSSDIRNKIIH